MIPFPALQSAIDGSLFSAVRHEISTLQSAQQLSADVAAVVMDSFNTTSSCFWVLPVTPNHIVPSAWVTSTLNGMICRKIQKETTVLNVVQDFHLKDMKRHGGRVSCVCDRECDKRHDDDEPNDGDNDDKEHEREEELAVVEELRKRKERRTIEKKRARDDDEPARDNNNEREGTPPTVSVPSSQTYGHSLLHRRAAQMRLCNSAALDLGLDLKDNNNDTATTRSSTTSKRAVASKKVFSVADELKRVISAVRPCSDVIDVQSTIAQRELFPSTPVLNELGHVLPHGTPLSAAPALRLRSSMFNLVFLSGHHTKEKNLRAVLECIRQCRRANTNLRVGIVMLQSGGDGSIGLQGTLGTFLCAEFTPLLCNPLVPHLSHNVLLHFIGAWLSSMPLVLFPSHAVVIRSQHIIAQHGVMALRSFWWNLVTQHCEAYRTCLGNAFFVPATAPIFQFSIPDVCPVGLIFGDTVPPVDDNITTQTLYCALFGLYQTHRADPSKVTLASIGNVWFQFAAAWTSNDVKTRAEFSVESLLSQNHGIVTIVDRALSSMLLTTQQKEKKKGKVSLSALVPSRTVLSLTDLAISRTAAIDPLGLGTQFGVAHSVVVGANGGGGGAVLWDLLNADTYFPDTNKFTSRDLTICTAKALFDRLCHRGLGQAKSLNSNTLKSEVIKRMFNNNSESDTISAVEMMTASQAVDDAFRVALVYLEHVQLVVLRDMQVDWTAFADEVMSLYSVSELNGGAARKTR
eukprot:PhM_4_TR15694/c1_g1_i1/m.101391